MTAADVPPRCPRCGKAGAVVPILYGLLDERYLEETPDPPFDPGGCCVSESSPVWSCRECGEQFGLSPVELTPQSDDDLVAAAATSVGRLLGPPRKGQPENQLRAALAASLMELGVSRRQLDLETARIAHDWNPLPGGIDLFVRHSRSPRLRVVVETKVEKVDETLWDLLKVAAASNLAGVEAGYLAVAASPGAWAEHQECTELFPPLLTQTEVHDVIDLIGRNRKAWRRLLNGGRARPISTPRSLVTRLIARTHLPEWAINRELRIVRVEIPDPDNRISFGSDGWPVDVDEVLKLPVRRGRSAAADVDTGPYPRRFTWAWLEQNVPLMADDEFAPLEIELRSRSWNPHELKRVRALRLGGRSL